MAGLHAHAHAETADRDNTVFGNSRDRRQKR
jgi:hypothetical protein